MSLHSRISQVSDLQNNIRSRLKQFSVLTGYPVHNMKYLRKIGPPLRPTSTPVRGSEVFAHRLPIDALDDEIFWFFQRAGDIYEIRLMLRPSEIANRGYAFVRYMNPEQAQNAITTLSNEDFRPNHKICLETSVENSRLFLSGLPLDKTKAEIWYELLCTGVRGIVDVITYKGYKQNHANRGFVFIEFENHENAAATKRKFAHELRLWNRPTILDWAEPIRNVHAAVMAKVTRIFLRNLDVNLKKEKLISTLKEVLDFHTVEKVYKHLDYSFIHFFSREMAEFGLKKLQEYFSNTDVEVTWSKPPGTAKNRILPPRLQKKINKQTKFPRYMNSEPARQLTVQFQQTSKQKNDGKDDQFKKIEEYMNNNSPWLSENCNRTNKSIQNEENVKPWELRTDDFNWFNCCVGKHENRERCATGKEDSNQRNQDEAQSSGLRNVTRIVDEKRYTNLVQDARSSLIHQESKRPLNLRLGLDLYENRGSKYSAS